MKKIGEWGKQRFESGKLRGVGEVTLGPPALETITIDPTEEHRATVVFLHGLGDTGRGVRDICTRYHLPHVKWVLPSASRQPVTCNGGRVLPAWFDVVTVDPEPVSDVGGADKAARYIAQILKKEKAMAPEGTKIFLGGLSQGGVVTLHLTVRKFVGTFLDGTSASNVPLDGTFALSTRLSDRDCLQGLTIQDAQAHPFIMFHGEDDKLVRLEVGQRAFEELRCAGFSGIQLRTYPGLGHHPPVCEEELDDLGQWLGEKLSS